MEENVQLVINAIADDLLALAHAVLEDDTVSNNVKIRKNTLRDSALNGDLYAAIAQTNGDSPVITAFFNHYVVYLERGRPPKYGKKPPIHALKDWAAKVGLPTDTQTLWKLSTAIWRDGQVGRPIFATMDREADLLFNTDWADNLFNAVTSELDIYFNT